MRLTSDDENTSDTMERKSLSTHNLRILSIRLSSKGLSDFFRELVQSATNLQHLGITGNNEEIDFSRIPLPSPQLLTSFRLYNTDMIYNEDNVSSLSVILAQCRNLQILILQNCQLTAGKLLQMIGSLKENNRELWGLDLDYNTRLGKDIGGFNRCCQELAEFPALESLGLHYCGLADSALDGLKYLLQHRKLKEFDTMYIEGNRFENDEKISELSKIATETNVHLDPND
ncbi:MAG: hypothetical protein GY696_08625 [Gammaproteobacteria bacterium]|nr:hypothetical protein [Gammaproteobacteria bacterium]